METRVKALSLSRAVPSLSAAEHLQTRPQQKSEKKLSKNSLDTVHATRARLATETVLATSRAPSLFKRWTSFLATLE